MLIHPLHEPKEQFANVGGIRICYERLGERGGIPLIAIMGLACQMTAWPPEFLEPLIAAGRDVIRLDNRDMGHSSEMSHSFRMPVPLAFARYKIGMPVETAYRLQDLAGDTLGLMDALDLPRAHLVGVSMGGMIAQILAASFPDRVASLSLLMTSDNSPKLPMPSVNTLWKMNGGGVKGHDREAALKRGMAFWSTVASPGYPTPEERIVQRINRDYQRSYRPASVIRQMRAVLATGSLTAYSRRIKAPTLILHGRDDPLVKVAAARRLAKSIPHAHLEVIPGWGHDLPLGLCGKLAQHVLVHMDRQEKSK